MKTSNIDWRAKHQHFKEALSKKLLRQLAEEWQVPPSVLRKLGVGWLSRREAYTFPERDHEGRITGILCRDIETGKKTMIRGSHRGLYLPVGWDEPQGPILIPEGVSDTAVLLAQGLAVVGRPACKGGVEFLGELLADHDREIVVIGENDLKADGRWPGRDGAEQVASNLANMLGREVQWTLPPEGFKDVREYLNAGGRDDQ